jgi:hypothetical protein
MAKVKPALDGSNATTLDDIPAKHRREVQAWLNERWDLKIRQEHTKEAIDELNANLCEAFIRLDIKAIDAGEFIGTLVNGVNVSVNGQKVRARALERGVDADIIEDIMNHATSVKEYVTFSVRGKRGAGATS